MAGIGSAGGENFSGEMRVRLWKGSCRLARTLFSARNLAQHTPTLTTPCIFPWNGIFCHWSATDLTFWIWHCQKHGTMVATSQLNCCYW